MSTPTIVFLRAHYIEGRMIHPPGEEVPPDLFSQETIDRCLDEGALRAYDPEERVSLYRIFHRFTGTHEAHPLTPDQLTAYTLPT